MEVKASVTISSEMESVSTCCDSSLGKTERGEGRRRKGGKSGGKKEKEEGEGAEVKGEGRRKKEREK